MNALELASHLDKRVHITQSHEAAAMLRRQHEAIKQLREALAIVFDGHVYLPPITRSIVGGVIQSTKEFK